MSGCRSGALDGCIPSRAQKGPVSLDSISRKARLALALQQMAARAPSSGWGEPFSPAEGPPPEDGVVSLCPRAPATYQSTKVSAPQVPQKSDPWGLCQFSWSICSSESRVPQPRRELRGRLQSLLAGETCAGCLTCRRMGSGRVLSRWSQKTQAPALPSTGLEEVSVRRGLRTTCPLMGLPAQPRLLGAGFWRNA